MQKTHARQVSPKHLEARRLRDQGVTGAEIARRLGVSMPTVWRWLAETESPASRARTLVSRALIELGKVEA